MRSLISTFPERCALSPGLNIWANSKYKFTRVLNGTTVHNEHEVLLGAVALPTSFAQHGLSQADAESLRPQKYSLLNAVLPFARGDSCLDKGCVARLWASIVAGGAVHEDAEYFTQWKELQFNSSHVTIQLSIIGEGKALFWDPQWPWPSHEPLYVYGGFNVHKTDVNALETIQQDYLLKCSNGPPDSFICGKPWDAMPKTHIGGYASHPNKGHAHTTVKWISMRLMLPNTMREWLTAKGLLHSACESMRIPIVYAGQRAPGPDGEITMSYGRDPVKACPGVGRALNDQRPPSRCSADHNKRCSALGPPQ